MEILLNAIIKATGWSIIHSLWQGAILYSILLLLFVLNPRLTAKSRHNLSFLALSGIFVWFSLTFYNEFTTWLQAGKSLASIHTYTSNAVNVHPSVVKLPSSILYKADQSIPLIVCIYCIGLAIQVLFLLGGYYKVWLVKTRGLTDLPAELNEQFCNLIAKVGIKRKIQFKFSSGISVPLVIGYFKPIVLLPLSLLSHLQPQQLEAIIIHELSHIRRNDYLLNLFKVIIEAVLFFNPFIWLTGKLINSERENACDDLVLELTGNPLSYAQTLLVLEKLKHERQLFAMAITGKKYHLLNRIKRIITMKTNASNFRVQLFTVLMIVTTVCSLAWIPTKKEKAITSPVKTESSILPDREHFVKQVIITADKPSPAETAFKSITKVDVPEEVSNSLQIVLSERIGINELVQEKKPIVTIVDTIEFNSFNIKPDDNAQELLKTLPGIQVDKDGKIIAYGRTVTKVLVDGKEFFSDDPALAMQIKGRFIDKVQVINNNDKEALLKQLPGIEIDKVGKITAQGSPVTKVLIDGKEYFGNQSVINLIIKKNK